MRARESYNEKEQTVTKTITVNGTPAADFGFTPAEPLEGEAVASRRRRGISDDPVTLDGTSATAGGRAWGHPACLRAAGTYAVELTATDEHGAATTVSHQVTVAEARPSGPAPSFVWTPSDPVDGARSRASGTVGVAGSSTVVGRRFDADAYTTPRGPRYTVGPMGGCPIRSRWFRVQDDGTARWLLRPASWPARPGTGRQRDRHSRTTPDADQPEAGSRWRCMRPFPGGPDSRRRASARGAREDPVRARAARGAGVLVRCRGTGCPVGAGGALAAPRRLLRIHRFERTLAAPALGSSCSCASPTGSASTRASRSGPARRPRAWTDA